MSTINHKFLQITCWHVFLTLSKYTKTECRLFLYLTRQRKTCVLNSLSMGVNVPDVKFVIQFGPPRALAYNIQDAGGAGRNSETAHNIIIYHENQLFHCEGRVKELVKAKDYLRIKYMDDSTKKPKNLIHFNHQCCHRERKCKCETSDCKDKLPHLANIVEMLQIITSS